MTDSGKRTLRSWNPNFGISYNILADQYIFSNYATSFETPSLSELSANPSGREGFNKSLNPQEAINYELGIKGTIKTKTTYELVLFHIITKNELVPFELVDFPGRAFYRNSGAGERNGLEFSFNQKINHQFNFQLSYSFSDFIYEKYELNDSTNFNNNKLPGIPTHFGNISLHYLNKDKWHARIQGKYIGELFTNDANTISDNTYFLLSFNAGYEIKKSRFKIIPFLGINNILNVNYNDNIRLNAFGGRYFEPGPGLNIYGGIRLNLKEE